MTRGRTGAAIAAGIALAAVLLRVPTLGLQSFWLDEAYTAMAVGDTPAATWDGLHAEEATPPLYYMLAWAWTRLFGEGDVAFRSLSVLAGLGTVWGAYLLGREVASRRAGAIAAALCATSPLLVWYSQEARAYALLTLLAALSLLFFVQRRLGLWALMSALALCTHYFAVFVIVPCAIVLLAGRRGRRELGATAAALAPGLLLLPLALDQADSGRSGWIHEIPLTDRLTTAAKVFVSGVTGAPTQAFAAVAAIALGIGLVLGLREAVRRSGRLRDLALVTGIGLAAVLLLTQLGADYLHYRNLLYAWVPLAVVAGAGLAQLGMRSATAIALAGCLALTAINIGVFDDPDHQRDDWEMLAHELGPADPDRYIGVVPDFARPPLERYRSGLDVVPASDAGATEVALVGDFPDGWSIATLQAQGLRVVSHKTWHNLELVNATSDTAPLTPGSLIPEALGLPLELLSERR